MAIGSTLSGYVLTQVATRVSSVVREKSSMQETPLKEGDLVLILDNDVQRNQWKKGVVTRAMMVKFVWLKFERHMVFYCVLRENS